jgi:integrase
MPSKTLTDSVVRSLKAADKQIDVWDKGLPGFLVRLSPGGAKTFQVFYRHRRRQRRYTLGRYPMLSLAAARQMAKSVLADAIHGRDPAGDKRKDREAETFARLSATYMERHAKKFKKSWSQDQRMIATYLEPQWRARKLNDISSRDVRELVQRLSEQAPVMANRVLGLIKRMFNFFIEEELIEDNPAMRVKRPGVEKERSRVLSDDEILTLWNALEKEPQHISDLLKLQLLTAQRISEVRQLRVIDIDLKSQWWTIPGEFAKNGRRHRVPLVGAALEIVTRRVKYANEQWLFPAVKYPAMPLSYHTVNTAVRRIDRNSGLADWGTHDLRRTAITLMSGSKVDRIVLEKLLNHSERKVIGVYDRHSYDSEKKQALEMWDRRLKRILANVSEPSAVLTFTARQTD